MRLVEENARAHIHCDVVNCLREEGMNIMQIKYIHLTISRCDY